MTTASTDLGSSRLLCVLEVGEDALCRLRPHVCHRARVLLAHTHHVSRLLANARQPKRLALDVNMQTTSKIKTERVSDSTKEEEKGGSPKGLDTKRKKRGGRAHNKAPIRERWRDGGEGGGGKVEPNRKMGQPWRDSGRGKHAKRQGEKDNVRRASPTPQAP